MAEHRDERVSLLYQLVCSCREDNCPRRAEADRVLAGVWAEGVRWAFNDADADANPDDHNPYCP